MPKEDTPAESNEPQFVPPEVAAEKDELETKTAKKSEGVDLQNVKPKTKKSFFPVRNAIRIRVKFTPTNIPLFPGRPLDEQAWSEIRYDAYCWVLP